MQSVRVGDRRLEGLSIEVPCDDGVPVLPCYFAPPYGIGDSAKENSPRTIIVVTPVEPVKKDDQAFLPGGRYPLPQADAVTEAMSQTGKSMFATNEDAESFWGRSPE
jgi:hypothetical protein